MDDNALYKLQKWAAGIQYHNMSRAVDAEVNKYIHKYGRDDFIVMAGISDDIELYRKLWVLYVVGTFIAFMLGLSTGACIR